MITDVEASHVEQHEIFSCLISCLLRWARSAGDSRRHACAKEGYDSDPPTVARVFDKQRE